MQGNALWPAIPTEICLGEWTTTDEPDLNGGVGTLGMIEAVEKTEMLLCARRGCAAQTGPCTSCKHIIHQAVDQ